MKQYRKLSIQFYRKIISVESTVKISAKQKLWTTNVTRRSQKHGQDGKLMTGYEVDVELVAPKKTLKNHLHDLLPLNCKIM